MTTKKEISCVSLDVEAKQQIYVNIHQLKMSEIGNIAYQLAGLDKNENRLNIVDYDHGKFFVKSLKIGNVTLNFFSRHYKERK